MINFSVPQDVGIGLARGTASRLLSGEKTLDYSGRVLNLAARLMELARPRGLVFDGGLSCDVLPSDLAGEFQAEEVYLKGVSPTTPMLVHYWPRNIEIPVPFLRPHGAKKWEQIVDIVQLATLEHISGDELFYTLSPLPCETPELFCIVTHDAVTPGRRKSKAFSATKELPVTLVTKGANFEAEIQRQQLVRYLRRARVGRSWDIRIELNYRSL